jgi:phosphoribosylformylglycinamidine synthase
MIQFFKNPQNIYYAVQVKSALSMEDVSKLNWLFGGAELLETDKLEVLSPQIFVGPRAAMVTPWSTNAVEITQNMGVSGIVRIEEFGLQNDQYEDFDPMLMQKFKYCIRIFLW